jgi:uncharacterized protein
VLALLLRYQSESGTWTEVRGPIAAHARAMSYQPVQPRDRIHALDALRGFALCGIIFINIPQTLDMLRNHAAAPVGVRLFVLGRFYPIFYLLFGVGFGLFLFSAMTRTDRPRLPLLRRLAALAGFGLLHHLLQPGEVLLPFAITGLVVLLPASYLSGRVNVVLAALLTVGGLLLGVGGLGLLPGLFLFGFALAQLGAPRTVPDRTRLLAGTAVVFAVVAFGLYRLVLSGVPDAVGNRLGLAFSLSMAVTYAAAFLVLLRTPAGPVVSAVLAPLGRMALTNYLTATVLFVVVGNALDLDGSAKWGTAALLGVGILLVQAGWSALWLSRFRYGPLEWVWRCVTYWRPMPIRLAERTEATVR